MLDNLSNFIDRHKTYAFAFAWCVYRVAVSHGLLHAMPDLETMLLAGGGAALKHDLGNSPPL